MTSPTLREQVARIIDPYGFALVDRRHLPDRAEILCANALDKAEAILALFELQPRAPQTEGDGSRDEPPLPSPSQSEG